MDLGKVGNSVAQLGMAAVGAYVGGYTGLQIGLSVGSLLFHAKEAKQHKPFNDLTKSTSTYVRPDPVPVVIGTDMCPGNVIWLNDSVTGMVNPSYYENVALDELVASIPAVDFQFFNIEFIASFASAPDRIHINNVFLNNMHHWLWHRFDDWLHYMQGWTNIDDPWNSVTNMVKHRYWNTWYQSNNILNYTVVKEVSAIHWKGAMFLPLATPADVSLLEDFGGYYLIGNGPVSEFPNLTAEISELNLNDLTIPPYTGAIGSRSHTGYNHTYRDNNSHYLYGVLEATGLNDLDEDWYFAWVSIRRLNFYTYTYTLLISHEDAWNTITKGYNSSQSISRQDIDDNPDHLYIFHGRNWFNGNTYGHHHAAYSLEYDIFYIDRSDDSVHSVCFQRQISLVGDDDSTPCPRVRINSMEIVGDSILLFGQEYQTHSIWDEVRTLTANGENLTGRRTKLYADFSKYPNNYWVDDTGDIHAWAYFNYSTYGGSTVNSRNTNERYRIIEQTSNYIVVDGWYALRPNEGNTLYITRVREFQAGWSIVGAGSTRNYIICNPPSPFDPNISTLDNRYKAVQFQNYKSTSTWGFVISSIDGTRVNLASALPSDPVVGEVIWFSFNATGNGSTTRYTKYTNPINYWFIDNFNVAYGTATPTTNTYNATGLWNRQNWGKSIILKINKFTGAFESKIYESYFRGYNYTVNIYVCIAEAIQISTVSTDNQIAVSFQMAQPYAYLTNNNLIIDKSTLSIVSNWIGDHSLTLFSHAAGKVYRGCLKVRAWDDHTRMYSYRWYALVAEFMAQAGVRGTDEQNSVYNKDNVGYYMLDLGEEGIFPPMDKPLTPNPSEEFSSILNVDANQSDMIKWFRPQLATTPTESPFFLEQSTIRDSMTLRMYDYDEKLFFVLDRGSFAGMNAEVWCYKMPNEYDRYGFSWPVSQAFRDWSYGQDTSWGDPILSCKYYLGFGGSSFKDHFSNFCDCYISSALRKLPLSINYFTMAIDSSTYANELISDKVIFCGKEHDIIEPRFMFSMCWSEKKPLMDMVRELTATCQGMIIPHCEGTRRSILKIPTPNETPSWYFGYEESNFVSNLSSVYQDVIYINLSAYPFNYWQGDSGILTRNGLTYPFTIEKQYSNYIELESQLPIVPLAGDQIFLVKDNMIESSFAFSKKPQYERANRIRIEFINRLLDYKIDIAEADDTYKQEIIDKRIITKHIELHGIKRASQAARMAYRYLDYEQYVNWMCSFQTDVMGSYICYGDIIGITHPVTGWFAKPFRVLRKEEMDDMSVVIECEEYVGSIYHDASNPIYQGSSSAASGPKLPISDIPDPVRRLYAHYDDANNLIYVAFYSPQKSAFFVGATISYKLNNGEYQIAGFANRRIASVIYSFTNTTEPSAMEPTRTKYGEMEDALYKYRNIPYDPLTMLGTFPSSGYLWINGELIYYGGIDTVNNRFTNIIRGINVPEYQYAVDALDDGYNWTNPLITLADTYNAFKFSFDPSLIDLINESNQTEGSDIAYNIPTITIKAQSLNILGIGNFTEFNQTYSFQLRYNMNRPYPPTLLRYSRDFE